MSLKLAALTRAAARGPFTRVLVLDVKGSAPREAGAEMYVWPDDIEGTIGGGALEWQAMARAREGLVGIERVALGPALGQCCGGAVTLFYEALGPARVAAITGPVWARPISGGGGPTPPAVLRAMAGPGNLPKMVEGWVIEPVAPAPVPVWIWGAGHVGRALVGVLAPFDRFAIDWVDFAPERFGPIPPQVRQSIAADPVDLVRFAPFEAHHIVATHAHDLDFALVHAILGHGFASLGLIGSASKAARFATRLGALGHSGAEISRLRCPIGEPGLGKHPQAIAVGVAAALLRDTSETPKGMG
ncbi:xanthine dehydrogenase accessory protein XdhC [Phaeovulum sp.]|uniref:xanthine dehydrogenase accessory protein XdhC n=1 Tax=Phaeovulum sp. TaxID=2934796 RepID=UPI003563C6FE